MLLQTMYITTIKINEFVSNRPVNARDQDLAGEGMTSFGLGWDWLLYEFDLGQGAGNQNI